ncbi:putative Chaperone protein dnaK [Nannochloris sp. 'desiccata']|nr:putative Chaperone protein dnaK [Chlorella desiccata (nom. nud.)]
MYSTMPCAVSHLSFGLPRVNNASPRRAFTSTRLQAIVGIDLGTTNSAIAYVGSAGPEVIKDVDGNTTIPSVITITWDDELLIGWPAVEASTTASSSSSSSSSSPPDRDTFTSFKRLLGRKYKEIVSSDLLGQLPFQLHEGDRGEALVYSAGADGMITPLELSTWLVKHLIHTAQMQLRESITGAVVTVPAHFDQRQRGATLEVVQLAGVSTVHLLQEPVAAALAYGIDGGTDGETVLVFDIGGGTFDVSVLQAFEGIMQILSTDGDSRLGGDDFDSLLAQWILEEIEGRGTSTSSTSSSNGAESSLISEEESEMRKLWALNAARKAKEALSESSCARIPIPSFFASNSGDGDGRDNNNISSFGVIELTQEKFENISEPLFQRMAEVLGRIGNEVFVEWAVPPQEAVPSHIHNQREHENTKSTLQNAEIANTKAVGRVFDKWAPPPRKISKVALVGQITRLPSVRNFIQRITGVEPCTSIDPGAAVALGAATHAGVLLGSVGSVELMDGSFVSDLHSRVTGFSEWQP